MNIKDFVDRCPECRRLRITMRGMEWDKKNNKACYACILGEIEIKLKRSSDWIK